MSIAMRCRPGLDLDRVEAHRRASRTPSARDALGVDLADQHPLALGRRAAGQRGRHRRLADAALAGDEEETAIEQAGHGIDQLSGPVSARAPKPISPGAVAGTELDVGDCDRWERRPTRPSLSVSHSTETGPANAVVDVGLHLVAVDLAQVQRPRSPWRLCNTPIRTSTLSPSALGRTDATGRVGHCGTSARPSPHR